MLGRLFERLYRLGLHLCPRSFREDYGDEVAKDFMRLAREAGHDGWWKGILFALRCLLDFLRTARREHIRGHPFHGWCTLVCCKPAIRRKARPGDWIVG